MHSWVGEELSVIFLHMTPAILSWVMLSCFYWFTLEFQTFLMHNPTSFTSFFFKGLMDLNRQSNSCLWEGASAVQGKIAFLTLIHHLEIMSSRYSFKTKRKERNVYYKLNKIIFSSFKATSNSAQSSLIKACSG